MHRLILLLPVIWISFNVHSQTTPGGISTSLQLWLKADSGVTVTSGSVSQWDDQSDSGRDVLQGTAARRPNHTANIINFNPVLRFSPTGIYGTGNADYLTLADVAGTNIDFTNSRIYIVGRKTHSNQNFAERTGSGTNTDPQQRGISVLAAGTKFDLFDNWIENGGITPAAGGTLNENRIYRGTTPFSVTDGLDIGHGDNAFRNLNGDIAEFIIYGAAVLTTEERQIESYLAIKYGITLDNSGGGPIGDYLSADSTTFWDASANSSYHNDVFGIGRDDSSALGQVKSKSINSDAVVTIEADGEGTNSSNSFTDIAHDEFLMTGNDNGSANWTLTGSPQAFKVLARKWYVQETGDVGIVKLTFDMADTDYNVADPIGNSSYYFIYDTDSDGNLDDESPIAMTNTSGDIYETGNINLADGQIFTIATAIGPAGIAESLTLWLRASDSTTVSDSKISAWKAISKNELTLTAPSGGDPTFRTGDTTGLFNFNPYIDFTLGSTQLRKTGLTSDLMVTPSSAIVVYHYFGGTIERVLGYGNNANKLTIFNSSGGYITGGNNKAYGSVTADAKTGQTAIIGLQRTSSRMTRTYSGKLTSSAETYNGNHGMKNEIRIGRSYWSTQYLNGYVAEVIFYNDTLTDIELKKVHTYLAIRYGITLDNSGGGTNGDYLSSDSTVVWDASDNAGYHNQVIGIGRDDNGNLLQKQSQTNDDSLRVFIGTLADDNPSNTSLFTDDNSYLMIGNKGGKLMAFGHSGYHEMPAGLYSRLEREWKVTNTNFSDDFSIELKLETPTSGIRLQDLRLLVDADGDFSNATIINSPNVTFSFGSIIISGIGTAEIPANSTRFITLASANSNTPLPVDLTVFQAVPIDDKVELNWTTHFETDNDYFTVERSANADIWMQIITINGAGNSNVDQHYSVIDNDPVKGVSYYRLKQTDFNGEFSYSGIESVYFGGSGNAITVSPNPTSSIIEVESTGKAIETVKVYDALGRDVSSMTRVLNRKPHSWIMDLSLLESGYYFIKSGESRIKVLVH